MHKGISESCDLGAERVNHLRSAALDEGRDCGLALSQLYIEQTAPAPNENLAGSMCAQGDSSGKTALSHHHPMKGTSCQIMCVKKSLNGR